MSCRKVPLANGCFYHVFNKSIAGFEIFRYREEYRRMLESLRFYRTAVKGESFSLALRDELTRLERVAGAGASFERVRARVATRQGADAAHDIDLLVVVTEGANRRATTGRLYGEIRGERTPFDLVVATPSDLEGRRNEDGLVYADIVRDGREVYAA